MIPIVDVQLAGDVLIDENGAALPQFQALLESLQRTINIGAVLHTAVTTATRTITDNELILGINIFGVNFAGAVSITLPAGIDSNKIIVINDESGQAGTNNITLQVA